MRASTDTEKLLEAILDDLERLRHTFQLHFQGLEKRPPTKERDRIKTMILKNRSLSRQWNTKDRFKITTIHQKFLSYNRMWNRTLKEIEDGTYRIHRAKVKRQQAREEQQKAAPPPENARPRDPAARKKGSEERLRKLYNVYMQAKKRTGESSNLSYDALKRQLAKQIPAIKKKHGCKKVDFKVVLKDGKAMLKAVPK